jgi:RNA polymerase sigma-70 factor (ECF subfamily)
MGPNRDPSLESINEGEQSDQRVSDAGALDEPSDTELVSIVCQGDESAFELIFNRHKTRVLLIAGRFFQEQVEDVLQECFVRAYFALPGFVDRGEGSFAAWLSKIAFNVCYDELRRRGRRRESRVSDLSEAEAQTIRALSTDSQEVSIESAAVSRDLANRLLAQLSAEDRIVLVLLDVKGLSVSEIAKMMDWSTAKVKVRIFRARRGLRRILEKFL